MSVSDLRMLSISERLRMMHEGAASCCHSSLCVWHTVNTYLWSVVCYPNNSPPHAVRQSRHVEAPRFRSFWFVTHARCARDTSSKPERETRGKWGTEGEEAREYFPPPQHLPILGFHIYMRGILYIIHRFLHDDDTRHPLVVPLPARLPSFLGRGHEERCEKEG